MGIQSPCLLALHDLHGWVFLLPCSFHLPTPVSCPLSARLPRGACLWPSREGTSVPADFPLIQYPRDRGGAAAHLRMSHRGTVTPHIPEGLPQSLSEADASVLFFVSCLQTVTKKCKNPFSTGTRTNFISIEPNLSTPHPKSKCHSPKCTDISKPLHFSPPSREWLYPCFFNS